MATTALMLDPVTNDLYLTGSGQIAISNDDVEVVGLRIATRLRTFVGEWFLDRDLGVLYFSDVLTKDPDLLQVNTIMKAAIRAVRGVAEILTFNATFDRALRTYSIRFEVLTTDGNVVEGTF